MLDACPLSLFDCRSTLWASMPSLEIEQSNAKDQRVNDLIQYAELPV
jgi:hypothetical protein